MTALLPFGGLTMQIDDFEFEEEMTHAALAEFLTRIAEDISRGEKVEVQMPSLREGVLQLPLGEPVEMGIEVNLRKNFIHFNLRMSWRRPKVLEE